MGIIIKNNDFPLQSIHYILLIPPPSLSLPPTPLYICIYVCIRIMFKQKRTQLDVSHWDSKHSDGGERGLSDGRPSDTDDDDDRRGPSQNSSRRRPCLDRIPTIYFPGKCRLSRRIEEDQLPNCLSNIESYFKPFPGGIPYDNFVHVTKRLCGIPSFFNLPLCHRINELYCQDDDRQSGNLIGKDSGRGMHTPGGRNGGGTPR